MPRTRAPDLARRDVMIRELIPWVTKALEAAGIAAIAMGAVTATIMAVRRVLGWRELSGVMYEDYRRHLSRGILLGLEFLVAADIIGTVAVEPTFRTVGVLAVIVLIRTFLSLTLEVEVSGVWPWRRAERPVDQRAA
jgi:uncharacterized membrane protein